MSRKHVSDYDNVCPLCDRHYSKKNKMSRHHIFPKKWYGQTTTKVEVCRECHNIFNRLFPHTNEKDVMWTSKECVRNWVRFCDIYYKKNAFKIYPILKKFIKLY